MDYTEGAEVLKGVGELVNELAGTGLWERVVSFGEVVEEVFARDKVADHIVVSGCVVDLIHMDDVRVLTDSQDVYLSKPLMNLQ